jgi:hypothetical protein
MMRLLFACLISLASVAVSAESEQPSFHDLLKEGGLRYYHPVGFENLKVEPSVFAYEKRILHKEQDIEVRYSIRPLNRIQVDYEDPHNSAPHPNDLFDMLFRSVVEQLSERSQSNSKAYTPDQAKKLFNAGWAAVAVFDISKEVSSKYREGLLITMHKNDLADAYILLLTNDLGKHKPFVDHVTKTLAFVDKKPPLPPGSEESKAEPAGEK